MTESLKSITEPKLIAWSIQTDDFASVEKELKKTGLTLSKIFSGSRQTLDGDLLKYEFADILGGDELGIALPFIVKWNGSSVHPSHSSPKGCTLKKLIVTHRPFQSYKVFLKNLSPLIEMSEGTENKIKIEISSPNGTHFF